LAMSAARPHRHRPPAPALRPPHPRRLSPATPPRPPRFGHHTSATTLGPRAARWTGGSVVPGASQLGDVAGHARRVPLVGLAEPRPQVVLLEPDRDQDVAAGQGRE